MVVDEVDEVDSLLLFDEMEDEALQLELLVLQIHLVQDEQEELLQQISDEVVVEELHDII